MTESDFFTLSSTTGSVFRSYRGCEKSGRRQEDFVNKFLIHNNQVPTSQLKF